MVAGRILPSLPEAQFATTRLALFVELINVLLRGHRDPLGVPREGVVPIDEAGAHAHRTDYR